MTVLPDNNRVALLYVPCGNEDEARRIAEALLQERLVACANIYSSNSIYMWQGALNNSPEHVVILKTTPERTEEARSRALDLHSYELPCVLAVEVASANPAFAVWVQEQVAPSLAPPTEQATPEGSTAQRPTFPV